MENLNNTEKHLDIRVTLDVCGKICPEPVILTAEEIRNMTTGEVLEVVADDSGTIHDIPAWCKCSGNKLRGFSNVGEVYRFYIEKVNSD